MKLLMLLLLALPVYAQFDHLFGANAKRIQGKPVGSLNLCADGDALTWVSANNRFECVTGGGGGGGTIATQAQAEAGTSNTVYPSPLRVAQWARRCSVQTTSTVLTVAAGASSTVPCVYRIGNVIYSVTSAQTLTITGGSGNGTYYVYVSSLGVVTVQYSSGASLTVSASGLTGSAVTTPGWPTNGHIPLGTGSITSGAWGTPTPAESNYSVFAVGSSTTINAVQAGTGEYTFEAASSLATDDEFIANTPRYAATMGGTTSALTLSTGSSYSSPNANGVCVIGKNTVGNSSGTTTLSVNSATAKQIWKHAGTSNASAIAAGDLRQDQIYEFCYNTSLNSSAGAWVVMNPGGGGGSTTPSAPAGTWFDCMLNTCQRNTSSGANVTFTANTMYYVPLRIPYEVVDFRYYAFYVNTAAAGSYMTIALYDSSCNRVAGTQTNLELTGGNKTPQGTSAVTLAAGQYFVGFAVESASAGIIGYDYVYSGFRNIGSAATVFTGSTAPSGTGASFTAPTSCGTKTASTGGSSSMFPEMTFAN